MGTGSTHGILTFSTRPCLRTFQYTLFASMAMLLRASWGVLSGGERDRPSAADGNAHDALGVRPKIAQTNPDLGAIYVACSAGLDVEFSHSPLVLARTAHPTAPAVVADAGVHGGADAPDRGGSAESRLCGILSACCARLAGDVEPPGCEEVATSGNETLCGLGMEGLQANEVDLNVIVVGRDDQCGEPGGVPSMITDPACVALSACGSSMHDRANKATCQLAGFLDHGDRCASALAYFKSQGYCGAVAYDAGAWTGLLPIQGDAGS